MKTLTALLAEYWVRHLGWTLVQFLWQGTLLSILFAVLRGILRVKSAHVRYAMACTTLALLVAAPVATFLITPQSSPAPVTAWPLASANSWEPILPWIVAVWFTGVVAFSIRLMLAWRVTARLRATGTHEPPPEWLETMARLSKKLRLSRPTRLFVSALVEVPTVVGYLRPVVLIPVSALTGLAPEHIAALLAHELAHIRRLDYAVNLLQSIAEAVLFYHPAVWWVSDQIRVEREHCCDDLAVSASGDLVSYIRALTEMESFRPAHTATALAANGGSLVNRIRRLSQQTPSTSDSLPGPSAALAMVVLWLLGIGGVAVHGAPEQPLPVVPRPQEIAVNRPPVALPSVLFSPFGPAPQAPRAPQPAPTAPTDQHFTIAARIVTDQGHQGIPGVHVKLTGASTANGVPPEAITTASGAFSFTDVQPGKYRFVVDHPGFFPQGYPEITVAGSNLEIGDLLLLQKHPVSGVVKWRDGEPAAGAMVMVMGFRGGQYSRSPGAPQVANDKGEFAFPNGNPRRALFFAYMPYNQSSPDVAPRIVAPRFFPGVETAEQATVINMRTMPGFNQLNFVLDDDPGADVEGTVTSSYFPAGTPVQLGLVVPNVPTPSYLASVTTKVGDTFRLPSIPPGNYLLLANARRPAPNQQESSVDVTPLSVRRGEPIQGLNILVNEPAPLVGKVEIEETDGNSLTTKLTPPPQFGFQFESGYLESYGLVGARTSKDGDFRSAGAVRGSEYKLSPGMVLPCPCYLARMSQGDKDLIAGALPVVAGTPIHMVLRKDGATVAGRVIEDNKIPAKAFVVLAPEKRGAEYWYRKDIILPDGTFKLTNVAPGEYDLFAFDRDDDTDYLDPKHLAKNAASSVHVTVQPNGSSSFDVKMVRLP